MSLFLSDAAVKHYLEKEVPQLIAYFVGASFLDRLDDLVAFFNKIGLQRLGSLLLVPGTSLRAAKTRHERNEIGNRPVNTIGIAHGP